MDGNQEPHESLLTGTIRPPWAPGTLGPGLTQPQRSQRRWGHGHFVRWLSLGAPLSSRLEDTLVSWFGSPLVST